MDRPDREAMRQAFILRRRVLGLSQAQVGEIAQVSKASVSRFENGQGEAYDSTLYRLMQAVAGTFDEGDGPAHYPVSAPAESTPAIPELPDQLKGMSPEQLAEYVESVVRTVRFHHAEWLQILAIACYNAYSRILTYPKTPTPDSPTPSKEP